MCQRDGQTTPDLEGLSVGQEVIHRTTVITRDSLVRYAGASGDFNPIHYNDTAASSAGLDGVIAHGMLTMGIAASAVTQWIGDPGAIEEIGTRFTRPIPVPPDAGVEVSVTGTVGALDEDAGTARIDLRAVVDGRSVLGRARATVRLRQVGENS